MVELAATLFVVLVGLYVAILIGASVIGFFAMIGEGLDQRTKTIRTPPGPHYRGWPCRPNTPYWLHSQAPKPSIGRQHPG